MIRTLMALVLVSTVVMAQGNRGGGVPFGGKNFGHARMVEALKLTDDQKKEFEKLRTGLEKNAVTTRSKIELARIDLRQLYAEDTPDRSKIEEKARELGKLQTDLKLARTGFWFDVNKLLTADQKTLWKKMPEMMGREGGPAMWKMRGNRRMMMRGDRDDDGNEENGELD